MKEGKAFWVTLPGILTGIAAVITAVSGLIFGLYQVGIIGKGNAGNEEFQRFVLAISVNGSGTTDPGPGSRAYDEGTVVTITSIPDSGWEFDRWSGDYSETSLNLRITIDSDKSIIAHFKPTPTSTPTLIPTTPALTTMPTPTPTLPTTPTITPTPTTTPAPALEVTFYDGNLEAVIRSAIGEPEGPILTSALEGLNVLRANTSNIKNLTGLEYCTNLMWLYLSGNQISDISPLSSLTNLTYLDLGYNDISDISPLSSLDRLSTLILWDNQISDISPLSSLDSLYSLIISDNLISDISPLSSLLSLRVLNLRDNQISNISPLVENQGLTRVSIENNNLDLSGGSRDMQDIMVLINRGVKVNY